jgi:peptidoglycan/xylan/chitin deacetylase (PgdA/CDA1 family)
MIEAAVLLLCAALLGSAGWLVWRRLAGPPRHWIGRVLASALASLLLVSSSAYALMNARGIQVCGAIVPRVDTSAPVVALTFDDGPVPPYTNELLRVLAAKDVSATFFLTGRNLETSPELARRLVAGGHELGSHSYSHTRMVLKGRGFIRDELERTDGLIRAAGHSGAIHFRSPYFKKLLLLPLELWRTGKTNVTADVEPDADPRASAEQMIATARVEARAGSIVILHAENARRQESLRAVPGIIDALKQKGFRLVTVSELLGS